MNEGMNTGEFKR